MLTSSGAGVAFCHDASVRKAVIGLGLNRAWRRHRACLGADPMRETRPFGVWGWAQYHEDARRTPEVRALVLHSRALDRLLLVAVEARDAVAFCREVPRWGARVANDA